MTGGEEGRTCDLASLIRSEHQVHSLFRDTAPARKTFEAFAAEYAAKATSGSLQVFEEAGQLEGAVLAWPERFPEFGVSGQCVKILLRPGHPEALAWAEDAIRKLCVVPSETTLCTLSVAHRALLPALADLGLGLDSLELVGHTQTALSRLVDEGASMDFSRAGLGHEPLRAEHVDAALALRAEIFGAPEQRRFCWFACNPDHLVMHRDRFTDEIASGHHLWFVLLDGERMVGVFGSSLVPESPLWGPRGGLELYFGRENRGRGLVRTAYRIILQGLADGGYDVFKGATAQPAVMALGARMGRTIQNLNLRSDPAFASGYFSECIAACAPPAG